MPQRFSDWFFVIFVVFVGLVIPDLPIWLRPWPALCLCVRGVRYFSAAIRRTSATTASTISSWLSVRTFCPWR